ncbi:MAG: efflux RND transporter permease subunit [Phycisphaerales bacterium JB039]
MDPVRFAIAKPVTVTVGVILIVMFGLIGLGAIPIQLTPTVDRPVVTVTTNWPGRSPQEVVDEITKEQEERLKNVEGVRKMVSTTQQGRVEITLEFTITTNIDRARQDVSDALRQVPEYPEDVDEPVVVSANSGPNNAITWIILDVDPATLERHHGFDITTLYDLVDRDIKPYLERTAGVAEVNVYGGRPREVRVLLDPLAMAQRGLNHLTVMNALRAENQDVSAGTIADGKRDYRVRLVGQFRSTEEVLDTIVAYAEGGPVRVRDIGTVEVGYEKQRGFVRSFGQPSLAINAVRQTDANVVEVMNELRQRLEEIRRDILPFLHPTVGPDLRLRMVYDETTYIDSAVGLVTQNLWLGGLIAGTVLLIFLRSVIATGVIAMAIPISVIGTFLVMLVLGRTINVISLAGLAFAVGMVVDNAIVVLENIYRRRQLGDGPREAAYLGAREVWGAVLASTLTTIAVFIPVLTIQEEAGQLFRDISLAIVGAVFLSMLISITVIPAACSRWLRAKPQHPGRVGHLIDTLFGIAPAAAWWVRTSTSGLHWVMTGWRGWTLRPAIIVLLTVASLYGARTLAPPLDYLPSGNRNLVFGGLLLPPGQAVEQQRSLAERIEAQIKPYADASLADPVVTDHLAPIPSPSAPGGAYEPVAIENFFIGAFGGSMFVGATSHDDARVLPLEPLLTTAMNSLSSDVFGGARQSSLFGRGVGGSSSIDSEVSGPNLQRVIKAAEMMYGLAGAKYGFGVGVTASPGNFAISQPETRIAVNDVGRELGLSTGALATAVRGLFDGAYVGDFQLNGEPVDLVLLPLGGRLDYLEQVRSVPVATPAGPVVPIDTVLDITPALAPQEIRRIEELPAITISVSPPPGQPIEAIMDEIRAEIVEPARSAGMLDSTMRVRLEGTAAKLDEVRAALFGGAGDGASILSTPLTVASWLVFGGAAALAAFVGVRAVQRKNMALLYGAAGALVLGAVLGSLSWFAGAEPQLVTARFVWALIVVFRLMSALFESFIYPFVIMFTVPLAVVGGFIGLRIIHDITAADPYLRPQNLDTLTMLGFVILIGVVVNNAILLVHQALNFMRGSENEPMAPIEAVTESVRTRVRPIFMSTLTSCGGMLPLVIMPGAGSEMYRGLGSVVLGGLLVSTFFTLLLTPLLFSLVLDMKLRLAEALRGRDAPAPQAVDIPQPLRPAAEVA